MNYINFNGLGKKKTAVARIILSKGTGIFTINKKLYKSYFTRTSLGAYLERPFKIVDMPHSSFNITIRVQGGGEKGQAEAILYGIAKALLNYNKNLHKILKKYNLLTRDSRIVERKKCGQAGARKKFQFSKR
jgi:small subunit ribosomal protein S9